MEAATRDLFGLLGAVIILAGLTTLVVRGGQTAQVLSAGANGFATVIRAATQS